LAPPHWRGQTLGQVERTPAGRRNPQDFLILPIELGVVQARMKRVFQLKQGRHQGLRHILAAIRPEVTVVGIRWDDFGSQ